MTTKAEIEATLDVARRQLICADMIDNFERRERELTYWRTRVQFSGGGPRFAGALGAGAGRFQSVRLRADADRGKERTMNVLKAAACVTLWRSRWFDTLDIANAVGVAEADVVRVLDAVRQRERGADVHLVAIEGQAG